MRRLPSYALTSMLKTHSAKLQAQVTRLREDLDMQRSHRQQMSEEVLADARLRLEQLQQSVSSRALSSAILGANASKATGTCCEDRRHRSHESVGVACR